MSANAKKWLQLGGIAVAVCVPVLAWQHFSDPAPAKPVTAKTEETAPAPEPEEETDPLPAEPAQIEVGTPQAWIPLEGNPYEEEYRPAPARTPAPNLYKPVAQANGTPGTGAKKSGSGGGGGGGGGTAGGGTGSGSSEDAAPEETPAEETAAEPAYWIQTDADPRGETPPNSRHNTSCTKFKNVPGRGGEKSEGSACPLCGG